MPVMGYQNPIGLGKARCIATTSDAIKVETREHGILWIPQKVVHDNSSVWKRGDEGELVVEAWWA